MSRLKRDEAETMYETFTSNTFNTKLIRPALTCLLTHTLLSYLSVVFNSSQIGNRNSSRHQEHHVCSHRGYER